MELGTRAEAGVHETLRLERCDGIAVQVEAVMLIEGPLVPIEAEPLEVGHDLLGALGVGAARIEVLDAQDHAPACRADGQPGDKSREDIAQVHAARRRGREASDDRSAAVFAARG